MSDHRTFEIFAFVNNSILKKNNNLKVTHENELNKEEF